jgi:hypothetical protein
VAKTPSASKHVTLFAIGTGLWAVALAVLLILDAFHVHDAGNWTFVCIVAIALGVVAILYSRTSWRAR